MLFRSIFMSVHAKEGQSQGTLAHVERKVDEWKMRNANTLCCWQPTMCMHMGAALQQSHMLNLCEVNKLLGHPIEVGHEANGLPFFVTQGYYNNVIVLGKCGSKLPAAFFPYANSEKEVEVCYHSRPM